MLQDFLSQVAFVDVHINLRSADVFVPQHSLDGSQVCPSFQELRGKTVPESVRTDVFLDSCLLGIFLNIYKEGDSAEVFPSSKRDEDKVFFARFNFDSLSNNKPISQTFDG